MIRTATLFMTLMLVVGSVAVAPAAAAQSTVTTPAESATDHAHANNSSLAPGALLSGVVGVQEAEIKGNVERRAFGIKVANASTDDAKAEVLAEQLDRSQQRRSELKERLNDLRQARANGSISNGTYAAQAATIQTQLNNLQQMGEEMGNVSERLPNETLDENNVNVTAINTLRLHAASLSGPEVAAIAQTIAGPDAGQQSPQADDHARGPGATNQNTPTGGSQSASSGGNQTAADDANTTTPTGGQGSGSDSPGGQHP